MLYALENHGLREITSIPHEAEFRHWMSRLSALHYHDIREELRRRIDSGTIHTSSWIPGSNWAGTAFLPLYEACGGDEKAAGRFFGIILWKLIMEDHRHWSFGNYEKDGVAIQGKTYFCVRPEGIDGAPARASSGFFTS